MPSITSFFDRSYQTPHWLNKKLSRRSTFKAAAGAVALSALPAFSELLPQSQVDAQLKKDPWLTLDAVLNHLLPESPSETSVVNRVNDVSAKTIQATQYLINVVELQPTEPAEIEFIYKGVGWLNGYTQSKTKQNFVQLKNSEKEIMLKAISRSGAGHNWLENLIGYIYEAMLSPPIYGGNPNGIGWKWLEHQPGYPLPQAGGRFYELPGYIPILLKGSIAKHPVSNNRSSAYKASPTLKRTKA